MLRKFRQSNQKITEVYWGKSSGKILSELGDLGHTIYFGIKNVTELVIINFSDTIVMDNIAGVEGNAFYYQEDFLSDTWTYFDEQDGCITNIYDKNSVDTGMRKNFSLVFSRYTIVYFSGPVLKLRLISRTYR